MLAERVKLFSESVIREMTRHANKHGAVNLAQGMPDFDPPASVIEAASRAMREGHNQYAITWGAPPLREAIAAKAKSFNGIDWAEPDKHITVCCGSTEAMMCAMLALVNPGEEVIVFQPWYENYGPDTKLAQARPVYVELKGADWNFDEAQLRAAFSDRTKAIIVNTPHNPTGKVFNQKELGLIAELCVKHNVWAITDEIYEHILYDGRKHISIATLPGMADRTITISGLSKTFSITGWRLGYAIAPEEITTGIRRVHDFLTVGAPHPLQMAAAEALRLPPSYYADLLHKYSQQRTVLCGALEKAGFEFHTVQGAYYVMTDCRPFGWDDDVAFVKDFLIPQIGVAAVPGSSFFEPRALGAGKVRFMFAKKPQTLEEAGRRLAKLKKK
jgi:aspartate/methionine/tyrosine aminotransferase